MSVLIGFIKKFTTHGEILVVDHKGRETLIKGDNPGQALTFRMHDPALPGKIVRSPDLAVGEAYMDGRLDFGDGDLWDFMQFYGQNVQSISKQFRGLWSNRWLKMTRSWRQANRFRRSRRNVAHHYDLSSDLYDLFLDKERNYSCGYFAGPDDSLEKAQAAKKRRIVAKLDLKDGQTILDIGCGWGGMAFYLASMYDVEVLGITLSEEQHKLANERAAHLGLSDKVRFELKDYRKVNQTFDRVVSIGMFEHVGAPNFQRYFDKVHDVLTDDGVALIHTIVKKTPPAGAGAWIDKYIFPGGYIPSVSEVFTCTENSNFFVTDVEIWRKHYAETLKHWWHRFEANKAKALDLYDERFFRMWEFYLRSCEAEFRFGSLEVAHFQLTKKMDTLATTRSYILEREKALPLVNKFPSL